MAVRTESAGVLTSGQGATGASPDSVMSNGDNALYLEVVKTGTATVAVQQRLTSSGASTWTTLAAPLDNITGITKITEPAGEYRTNVTAFTNGTITVNYQKVRALSS